jgi:hypothetical protein
MKSFLSGVFVGFVLYALSSMHGYVALEVTSLPTRQQSVTVSIDVPDEEGRGALPPAGPELYESREESQDDTRFDPVVRDELDDEDNNIIATQGTTSVVGRAATPPPPLPTTL